MNSFWNNGKGMSGGDQMFLQIFRRLRNNWNKFYIITSIDGKKVIKTNKINNVKFIITQKMSSKKIFFSYLKRTKLAIKEINLFSADLIYSTSDFFPDVLPAYFYKKKNPSSLWFQCVFHIYPNWKHRPGKKINNFVAQYLQKYSLWLAKKADYILVINHQVKNYLLKNGFSEKQIKFNTPGIDNFFLEKLSVSSTTHFYQATFVARLKPSKGIFDLIKIWKLVVNKHPEYKLAIIGGGSDEIKRNMQEKIISFGLENNIDIFGYLSNKETFSLVKNSNLFLFPSHEEGFGIAVAEAMACGVPVIAWDLPVYKEIFENYIYRINCFNYKSFSDNILSLMSNQSQRKKIAKEAEAFIKKYDWNIVAKKHLEILQNEK